jgi:hypothetical protein
MDSLISYSVELGLAPDIVKPPEAIVARLDSALLLEAIRVRASTLTPVIEEILHFRPSSHWGINE